MQYGNIIISNELVLEIRYDTASCVRSVSMTMRNLCSNRKLIAFNGSKTTKSAITSLLLTFKLSSDPVRMVCGI
jgi:hypothetical protein